MRPGEHGFTLLETIVSLAIAAGVLAVLTHGVGGNWNGISRARNSTLALSIAKSQFAAAGLETPLADGQVVSGQEGPVTWTMTVRRRGDADGRGEDTQAFWLEFAATWGNASARPAPALRLRTLKLEGRP